VKAAGAAGGAPPRRREFVTDTANAAEGGETP